MAKPRPETIAEARRALLAHLREVAREKGMTDTEVAQAAGLLKSHVSRLFAGKYPPTLDTFLALCFAVGARVFVEDRQADTPENRAINEALPPPHGTKTSTP